MPIDLAEWKKLDLQPLSAEAADILALIANGFSPADIVAYRPQYHYEDVRAAAQEALAFDQRVREIDAAHGKAKTPSRNTPSISNEERHAKIRQKYPRAYMSWSNEEERELINLFESNLSTKEIATQLQRQPSAIRSRLTKLGLGSV
jgi:DNA-binding CsgD family transcriptional regulator